jgi:hypothetical protein
LPFLSSKITKHNACIFNHKGFGLISHVVSLQEQMVHRPTNLDHELGVGVRHE